MAVFEWFGIVGLFFDIVGAFFLAKAIFLKHPKLVTNAFFPERQSRAENNSNNNVEYQRSKHGVPIAHLHKVFLVKQQFREIEEANIGIGFLIVGFAMQIIYGLQTLQIIPSSAWVFLVFFVFVFFLVEFLFVRYAGFRLVVSIDLVLKFGEYKLDHENKRLRATYQWGKADNFIYDVAEHLMPSFSYKSGFLSELDDKARADWLREEVFIRYENCALPEIVYKQSWHQHEYYKNGCKEKVKPLF